MNLGYFFKSAANLETLAFGGGEHETANVVYSEIEEDGFIKMKLSHPTEINRCILVSIPSTSTEQQKDSSRKHLLNLIFTAAIYGCIYPKFKTT